jgi:hypothetical protein
MTSVLTNDRKHSPDCGFNDLETLLLLAQPALFPLFMKELQWVLYGPPQSNYQEETPWESVALEIRHQRSRTPKKMGTAVRWLNEEDINVYFGKKQNR